jgi:hypothetical protein
MRLLSGTTCDAPLITPDGETGGVGLEFLVLGEDGRIRLDYQFIES